MATEGIWMQDRSRESDFCCMAALRRMREAQAAVENAVMATPTGKRRNLLTAVNMHLMIQLTEMETAVLVRCNEGEG